MQENQIVQLGYDALAILIPALVALAMEYLRQRLGAEKLKKIQEELSTKQDLAVIAVKFAEQAYSELKGPEKYEKAAEWLVSQADKIGVKITSDEIKGLIEWALREIKDQLGEEWAITVGKPAA